MQYEGSLKGEVIVQIRTNAKTGASVAHVLKHTINNRGFQLNAPEITVAHNLSSRHGIRFNAESGEARLNSSIRTSSLSVAAKHGTVVLGQEAHVSTNNFHSDSKETVVDGSVSGVRGASHAGLRAHATGDLRTGTTGKIGLRPTRKGAPNVMDRRVQVTVKGNITNFGSIKSIEKLQIRCQNFLLPSSTKKDTAHSCLESLTDGRILNGESGQPEQEKLQTLTDACEQIKPMEVEAGIQAGVTSKVQSPSGVRFRRAANQSFEQRVLRQVQYRDHDVDDKAKEVNNNIARIRHIFEWKHRERGEVASQNITINTTGSIDDCCQFTAKSLQFKVNKSVIVRPHTVWQSGVVKGRINEDIVVTGQARLESFGGLRVGRNVITDTEADVVVFNGGELQVNRCFINKNLWYVCGQNLHVTTGKVHQEANARMIVDVRQGASLSFTINDDVKSEWFGDVRGAILNLRLKAMV